MSKIILCLHQPHSKVCIYTNGVQLSHVIQGWDMQYKYKSKFLVTEVALDKVGKIFESDIRLDSFLKCCWHWACNFTNIWTPLQFFLTILPVYNSGTHIFQNTSEWLKLINRLIFNQCNIQPIVANLNQPISF